MTANTCLTLAIFTSAGIWTNEVPFKLDAYMNNATLSNSAYANPVGFADKWAYDTPQRQAVARAHDETQVRPFPNFSLSSASN
jgi:hypothetical protein